MKESSFLENRIIKGWKLNKILVAVGPHSYKPKINLVTGRLAKFAKEMGLPLVLILNEYAYFFGYLTKETSFNKIYSRLGAFMDHYVRPAADINDEDVEFADVVETDWNQMHTVSERDFPFTLRDVLLKHNINVGKNTFFKHDNQFRDFCIIANFVRHNRKFYPQIHGMKEFFIHLPIIWRKPKEYIVYQYLKPEKTLEQYYQKIYGAIPRDERFAKFSELTSDGVILKEFANVWGVAELDAKKGK